MNNPPSSSSRSPLRGSSAPAASAEAEVAPAIVGPDLLLVESSLFWEKYKLPIVGAVALLVVAMVISEFYALDHAKKLAAAGVQLDAAKTAGDYRQVIDGYPGSMPAANAMLLLGRTQMDAKDYSGAAKTWRDFVDKFPQHALAPVALIGAGGACEALGKPDEARAMYQRAATGYQNSFAAPLARLDEAALLKAGHKFEDARHIYENIMASGANSDAAQQAAEELRLLRVMPSAPGTTPVKAAPAGSPPAAKTSPAATPAAAAVSPAATAAPASPAP